MSLVEVWDYDPTWPETYEGGVSGRRAGQNPEQELEVGRTSAHALQPPLNGPSIGEKAGKTGPVPDL